MILVLSFAAFQTADIVSQREKEEQLRITLLEMRGALDQFHQENLRFPDSIHELLTAPRSLGAFYLRRFPLNPMLASTVWEIASQTTLTGSSDYWLKIFSADTSIPNGPVIDIRCPPEAGTGLNGIPYEQW